MNISKYLSTPLLILTILLTTLWSVHTLHAQSSGYTPVSVNSPTNTSLKVTATPLELNNTTNMWSYKIDWKRTRNAQGSISIAEESSPTTKVLSLSPASQEGTQTVTLKPSTTYRVKFYSTTGYGGTVILSKKLTTLSFDDEQPDIDATYVQIKPANILQTQISELLAIIARLRAQLDAISISTTTPRIQPPQPALCTMEVRLCPDGITYVGRTGPQCESAPCPVSPSVPSSPVNVQNTVVVSNKSDVTVTNYPMQIGRPFKQGEIVGYPSVSINGSTVLTQADVKNRWSDGSVKFAILSFVLPNLSANSTLTLAFSNQSSGNNTALTKSQMLGTNYNFDAQIKLTSGGNTKMVSARDMLSNGDYVVWTSGPVATTIILADHSADRKYDMGFDSHKSFRPIFEATFWPATNQVRVRYIGENSNTKSLQDIQYDLALTLGSVNPKSVYSRAGLAHPLLTRWTKVFWLNGAPNQKINVDNNLAYLSQTTYFPVFDMTVSVPDEVVASAYSSWQNNPHDLYDSGGWTKYMPTTGGRSDISPFTNWTMRWLYTGDWRTREIALGMGDLAGAWRLHAREGDSTKKIDKAQTQSGLTLPISVYAYPNLWLPDNNGSYGQLAIPNARVVDNGWVADNAHQPDPFYAEYVLTGDHWYLEEAQMWASMSALANCPGSAQWCRGSGMAGLQDQVRGDAWAFRNRMNAAFITPDDMQTLKNFYTNMVNDVLAFWEGKAGITGTGFQNTTEWKWANTNTYKVARTNPLHFWSIDGAPPYYYAPWQQYYLLTVLGIAKERGYATRPLFDFLSTMLTKQISAERYNPFNLASYSIQVSDAKGNWYPTWGDVQAANVDRDYMKATGDFLATNNGAYYPILATAASSFMTSTSDGMSTWNFLKTNVKDSSLRKLLTVPGWYTSYYDGTGELGWNIIPR